MEVQFILLNADLAEDEVLYVVGNHQCLGNWNIRQDCKLKHKKDCYPAIRTKAHTISLSDMNEARFLEYKYIKRSKNDPIKWTWEEIPNRKQDLSCFFEPDKVNHVIVRDVAFNQEADPEIDIIFADDIETEIIQTHSHKWDLDEQEKKSSLVTQPENVPIGPGVNILNSSNSHEISSLPPQPLDTIDVSELAEHPQIHAHHREAPGRQSPKGIWKQSNSPKERLLIHKLYNHIRSQGRRLRQKQKMIMMLSIKLGLAKRLIKLRPTKKVQSEPDLEYAAPYSDIVEQVKATVETKTDELQQHQAEKREEKLKKIQQCLEVQEKRKQEEEHRELGEIEQEMKHLNLDQDQELLEKDSE